VQGSGHRLASQNLGLIQRKSLIKAWDGYYDSSNIDKYGLYRRGKSFVGLSIDFLCFQIPFVYRRCITKLFPTRSHTVAAQGGINAALGNMTGELQILLSSGLSSKPPLFKFLTRGVDF